MLALIALILIALSCLVAYDISIVVGKSETSQSK